jgi:hypothetical protein
VNFRLVRRIYLYVFNGGGTMSVRVLIVLLITCLAASGSGWSRSGGSTLAETARRADSAVLATCIAARPVQTGDGGMIFTVYEFSRVEVVAGATPAPAFTIRVAGGTAGRYRVVLQHAPRFRPGRSYLVLLRRTASDGSLLVAGAAAGVLPARIAARSDGWEIALGHGQKSPGKLQTAGPAASGGTGVEPVWRPLSEVGPLLRSAIGEVSR